MFLLSLHLVLFWWLSFHFVIGFSEETNDIRALSPSVRRFARRAEKSEDNHNAGMDQTDNKMNLLTELNI